MPRLINPILSRVHSVNDFTDENVTDRGAGLKAAAGFVDSSVGTIKATGYIRFTGVPSVGNSVVVNGTAFNFISGSSSGTDVHIEATAAAQSAALATILNASVVAGVAAATYTDDGAGQINISYDTLGTVGNAFTLTRTGANITLSGATLSGGASYNEYTSVITNFMHG